MALEKPIKIVNVHGPYNRIHILWDVVDMFGSLINHSLIMVGDLNLTFPLDEMWGLGNVNYPLGIFQGPFLDCKLN